MTGQVDANGSCKVYVDPPDVDAGAQLSARIAVTISSPADLSGRRLGIKDHNDTLVGEAALERFDGEANHTAVVRLTAPDEPGTYTWFAAPLPGADDAISASDGGAGQATPFSFTVKPHATRLMVLDLPVSVERGTSFTLSAGVKCSSGCDMTGRLIEVLDENGRVCASTELTGELWPHSDGLYVGRIAVRAPDRAGLCRWQVHAASHRAAYDHAPETAALNVRIVDPADCTLRVEAVDAENETPLPHASIVMQPYRAMADADGVAELAVAGGTYTIYVSCAGYYPVRREIEVNGDLTTRAPLQREPAQSKDR